MQRYDKYFTWQNNLPLSAEDIALFQQAEGYLLAVGGGEGEEVGGGGAVGEDEARGLALGVFGVLAMVV